MNETLKQLRLSSSGRCGRMDYFLTVWVFQIVTLLVVALIDGILGNTGIIAGLVMILLVLQGIFAGIRRLHDMNYSGWYLLISLIPIVNIFFVCFLLFGAGTQGTNRFGEQE